MSTPNEDFAKRVVGAIVSFDSTSDDMALLVPQPGTKRFAGEVIAAKPMQSFGAGQIPDCCITVRGRTGKEVSLGFARHYTQIHPDWKDADARCKPQRKTK